MLTASMSVFVHIWLDRMLQTLTNALTHRVCVCVCVSVTLATTSAADVTIEMVPKLVDAEWKELIPQVGVSFLWSHPTSWVFDFVFCCFFLSTTYAPFLLILVWPHRLLCLPLTMNTVEHDLSRWASAQRCERQRLICTRRV